MTEMNDKKITENTVADTRAKRRRILKAGAVIAPLAVTLHGGIPMAHASSAGCIEDMKKQIKVPHFKVKKHNGKYEYKRDGKMDFDPEQYPQTPRGNTGRFNDKGMPETHWDYIKNEDKHGASCLQSFEDSGRIYDDSDHDSHRDD